MLEAAGLSGDEERVYEALLRLPAASRAELAHQLDWSASHAGAVLRSLESRGMVSVVPGQPVRFRVAPPDLALEPLLRRREEEVQLIRAAMARLSDEYRRRVALTGASELIEVVHGTSAVAQRSEQLQRTAQRSVRALVREPVLAMSAADNVAEFAVLPRGIRYQVIYDRSLLGLPGDPFLISSAVAAGEEARVTTDLPLKLILADESLALIPVAPAAALEETSAMLVHRSSLLDALIMLFDQLWATASPVHVAAGERAGTAPPDDGRPSDHDLELLSFVLAGFTDQTIAGQLGVSVRTVQRRVSDMISLAGVRTRLQLIRQATLRGWL